VASGFGLSFRDTAVALGLFSQNGLMGSDAGTSLKSALLNLQPTTVSQIDLFKRLGLMTAEGANAFFDAQGKIKSLADISGVLKKSFGGMTDQQRLANMEMLFGSDAIRAVNILFNEGSEGAKKFAKQMSGITAEGVAKIRMDNMRGAVEELKGSVETFWIVMGDSKTGLIKNFTQFLQQGVSTITQFIRTPVGQFVLDLVAGIGLLLGSLGAFLLITSSVNLLTTQASIAFASLGKTAIASAFATHGLVGGFRALGIAAVQAMIPLLPYVAVGALIGGAIYFAYESFRSFQAVMAGTAKPAQGLLGFMQRLGGVLWSVGQVLSSWNGKSFNLGGMEASLKSLGILDFVLNLSTWLVRLYEFVRGVGLAFYEVFTFASAVVGSAYNYIVGAINSFSNALGFQGTWLQKSTSDIQNWLIAGKILGYTIMGVLVVSFWSLASAVIAATWPFLAIGTAVGALVYLIWNWKSVVATVTKWVSNAFAWLGNNLVTPIYNGLVWLGQIIKDFFVGAFWGAINAVKYYYTEFVPWGIGKMLEFGLWVWNNIPTWFNQAFQIAIAGAQFYLFQLVPWAVGLIQSFGYWLINAVPMFFIQAFQTAFGFVGNLLGNAFTIIGMAFYDLGSNLIFNIKNGILSVWESFKSWFGNLISDTFNIASMLGFGEESPQVATASAGSSNNSGGGGLFGFSNQNSLSDVGTRAQASQFQALQPTVIDRTLVTQEKPNVNVYVGGEQLFDIITKQGELDRARK
jgi:hypothetical protein